ncbi:MAG: hypothetical protein ACRC0J_11330 [Shewanella oncorhynchi]
MMKIVHRFFDLYDITEIDFASVIGRLYTVVERLDKDAVVKNCLPECLLINFLIEPETFELYEAVYGSFIDSGLRARHQLSRAIACRRHNIQSYSSSALVSAFRLTGAQLFREVFKNRNIIQTGNIQRWQEAFGCFTDTFAAYAERLVLSGVEQYNES